VKGLLATWRRTQRQANWVLWRTHVEEDENSYTNLTKVFANAEFESNLFKGLGSYTRSHMGKRTDMTFTKGIISLLLY
jgi:hypothetical protein